MITSKKLLVLKDMVDSAFIDLVIFDNEVDMKAVREKVSELHNRFNWTYDDLLKELDSFGGYSAIPTRFIETIEYERSKR